MGTGMVEGHVPRRPLFRDGPGVPIRAGSHQGREFGEGWGEGVDGGGVTESRNFSDSCSSSGGIFSLINI